MEYNGLLQKFPVDRPLTEDERRLQLKQEASIGVEPSYRLSVIRLNGTFLEMVDKYYAWKGALVSVAVPIGVGLVIVSGYFLFNLYAGAWSDPAVPTPLWVGASLVAMLAPMLVFLTWLVSKEAFAYTHYPMRFNRRTRMVHVFRIDGTVLSVPWNDVFFCLAPCTTPFQWDVRGHVLDRDGRTVRETFSLSDWSSGASASYVLRSYWEFVRRYMEGGAGAVNEDVDFCLPIADKRETMKFGFQRMFAEAGAQTLPMRWLGAVIALSFLPGRWVAMRTSAIPVWPKKIDDACRIDAEDQFIKDSRDNPPDLR